MGAVLLCSIALSPACCEGETHAAKDQYGENLLLRCGWSLHVDDLWDKIWQEHGQRSKKRERNCGCKRNGWNGDVFEKDLQTEDQTV